MQKPSFTVLRYADQVPPFAEAALERLYRSLYSSLAHLRIFGGLDEASTYAAWRGDTLVSVLLFRQRGPEVEVINQGIHLPSEEIEAFAHHIFGSIKSARRISFHAVTAEPNPSRVPGLRFECTEDIVVTLPASAEDYLRRLGKSTRKNIRQNLSRAQRLLPGFTHEVHVGSAVSPQVIMDIIGFNHARMARKNRVSALDHQASENLIALMRERGVVGLTKTEARLCAGTLACRIGDELYSLVNAHDPAYDAFGMGTLCCYLMIMASIEAGDRRFHLMGGQFGAKHMLLGQRMPQVHLVRYRSHLDLLKHAGGIARLASRAALYRSRSWLADQPHLRHQTPVSRTVTRVLTPLKQMVRGLKARAQP